MRFSKFHDLAPGSEQPQSPERRDFLKTAAAGAGAVAAGGIAAGAVQTAQAQSATQTQLAQASQYPLTTPWWPSKWGPDDQAGASSHMTPEKIKDAAKWIRDGKVYRIGHNYESTMPLFGARQFVMRIPGAPAGGPFGDNKLVYNDEFICTEIGQVGTQFDGLGHIGAQLGKEGDRSEHRFYNGFTGNQVYDAYGLKKLGVENCKPFFTRAHLIDVAGLTGQMWDKGQEIKGEHVQNALKKQKMEEKDIKPGDAVFFNTGWSALWMKNNDRFNSGAPGIGLEVAQWLVGKDIALTGSDTWATDVVPNPNEKHVFVCHTELITKHGIYNHENLVFDELIKDGKHRFVYIFAPMPIKGATGSAGSPIAVT